MNTARQDYLTTEVMTVTPQKLQLMLVEGALRLANLARARWQAGDNEAACEALIRCQQIVAEMIAGLDPRENPDLVKRITAVYVFVYRALIAANHNHDEAQLKSAIRVLEVERETWRALCQGATKRPYVALRSDEPVQSGQSFEA